MAQAQRPHSSGTGFSAETGGTGILRNEVVLFDPPAPVWSGLVRTLGGDQTARDTRRTLGLPTDRSVVMGGHQPGLWHPGILAKWFAVRALAARTGASPAWVVVDQSPGAGATIQYPAERSASGRELPAHAGEAACLVRSEIVFGEPDIPPASQIPVRMEVPDDAALGGVAAGLARLARLLEHHADKPTLARQLHAACIEAIESLAHAGESGYSSTSAERHPLDCARGSVCDTHSIFATELHATPAFAELVGAMREDPADCVRLYNEAAAEHPEAGVRMLAVTGGVVELPLWERSNSPHNAPTPWRTVMSDRLPDLPDDRLVLRGLPMTGLLRGWTCDLFVHGLGGGASHAETGYDRVTERWFAGWLGMQDLAPAVIASATLRLDFSELSGTADIPTPHEIARACARAHRAAHDPALLGDADLGSRKRDLARQIAALPRGSTERASLFAQMHSLRAVANQAHADTLAQFLASARTLAARANEAEIIADRTWSIAFFPPEALADLHESIKGAFGVS